MTLKLACLEQYLKLASSMLGVSFKFRFTMANSSASTPNTDNHAANPRGCSITHKSHQNSLLLDKTEDPFPVTFKPVMLQQIQYHEPSYPAAPCRPAPALAPEESQPPDCLRYRTPGHWAAAHIAKKKTLLSVAFFTGSLHKAEYNFNQQRLNAV